MATLAISAGLAIPPLALAGPAGAQVTPAPVDYADFVDPVTGVFDAAGYLAAVAAANLAAQCANDPALPQCANGGAGGGAGAGGAGGSNLPVTGSPVAEYGALGITLTALGGAALAVARRRRVTPTPV